MFTPKNQARRFSRKSFHNVLTDTGKCLILCFTFFEGSLSSKRDDMPLIEDEAKHTTKTLLTIGLPSFVAAAAISIALHQCAHAIVSANVCSESVANTSDILPVCSYGGRHVSCALSSAAGPLATFVLALVSFAVYLRFPRNLFVGSMAFINAAARLPETIGVFAQVFLHNRSTLAVDERFSLSLIHLQDPTLGMLILCFFAITIFFLTIIVVHDTKTVPWKWLVAFVLFVILGPLQQVEWKFVLEPLVG
jgi:hypothetical protein